MTKIDFPILDTEHFRQYCLSCHSENINRIFEEGRTYYLCSSCKTKSPRLLVIDPAVVWWIDKQTKEYWHESVGAFINNGEGKVLFFERTIWEFAFTIPAGHLDSGEKPDAAVKREIAEEVGVELEKVDVFSREQVIGDRCRRGADDHLWNLYKASIKKNQKIVVNDEGFRPAWLTKDEALGKDLTFAARYFIEKYGDSLFE